MQRIERFNRIRWLDVVLAVTLGTSFTGVAQEVGFIDLTQIVPRTALRHPDPRSDQVAGHGGGAGMSYECDLFPNAPKEAGAFLRTTLVWLGRSEYAVGDLEKFEVRIENVGSVPIKFPFSPHVADLQPGDASQKFGYSVALVRLWIGGTSWETTPGPSVALYGAKQHPDTMLTLHPGEWVRIIGEGGITHPEAMMDFIRNGDAVSHANARVSIYEAEMLLTATASAIVSRGVCLNQSQGPNIAMKLDEPK